MDIDSQLPLQSAPPSVDHGAVLSPNADSYTTDAATPTNKRKYQDLIQSGAVSHALVGTTSSPPPSSSSLPPSSPPHPYRSASSTPVPQSTSDAQKVYIARTAPHLLGRGPTPSSSRTPSVLTSGRSSPTSDDGCSTPDGTSSTPTSSNQSHHSLPEGYRGPALRKNDAEDFAASPHLAPTVGSATLFHTVNFAVNRNGWRYTAAGPASQHLPKTLFKTLVTRPASVHWCWSDRSPFTKISADADIVSTDKGFRSARTNIGVRQGEWYAEIEILPPEHLTVGVGAPGSLPAPMKDGPHVRLGWGRREAPLNAPVGFDGYSYGLTDKAGDKVTLSRPLPYGKPFKAGDVVGMYIKLPEETTPKDDNDPANIKRERIAIRYKGQLYFESLEYPRTREMEQLMERSRKGNSIEDALKGIDGTGIFEPQNTALSSTAAADGATGIAGSMIGNGASVPSAGSGVLSGGGGGSAKVKNRKNPGSKEKPSGPTPPSLRPIPKMLGSKIGFFVNGEPQGIAFRDLFDFRPLRVRGFSGLKPAAHKSTSLSSRSSKQDTAKKGDPTEPVINVKPRENIFDDGELGYFAFVSSYGGARAKLVTGENGFRFPPPDDIEAALEKVDSSSSDSMQIKPEASTEAFRRWKPLSARFEEHLHEMWAYDLQDEVKAQAMADKLAEEKARRNNAAKERYAAAKRRHAAALARNATASPAPARVQDDDDADQTITAEAEHMDVDEQANAAAARSDANTGSVGGMSVPPPAAVYDGDAARTSSTHVHLPPHARLEDAAQQRSWSRAASPEDPTRTVSPTPHPHEKLDDVVMRDVEERQACNGKVSAFV